MKTTLINAVTNEIKAVYVDGEKIDNPEPVKSDKAEAYEKHLNAYGELYEQATNRLTWRGGTTDLNRVTDTPEEQALKYAEAVTDLEARIDLWKQALSFLKSAERLHADGGAELYEYNFAMSKWHEANRYRELYAEAPELYTVHAIAIKKAMREAEQKAGKPWSKLTNYYLQLNVYATVNGVTVPEAEQALTEYIEARQMTYTVSTKNLKMRVS